MNSNIGLLVMLMLAVPLVGACLMIAIVSLAKKRAGIKQIEEPSREQNNRATGKLRFLDEFDEFNYPLFSENKKVSLNKRIDEILIEKKLFLQQRYQLAQLAEEVGVPAHHLSGFINHHYEMTYSELINKFRVNYSKVMIMNEEWKSKKLSAIAMASGFNNRNTFTVAFKKETGENPSDYLKRIKENGSGDPETLNTIERAFMKNPAS